MNKFEFDPVKHQYKLNGKRISGISEVIGNVLNCQGEEEVEQTEPNIYQQKGTIVHKTLEYLDQGILGEYDQRIQPYVDAWIKFKKDYSPEIINCELQTYNENLWIAGTIDRVMRIKGILHVIDIKTGKQYKGHPLQVAGYKAIIQPFYTGEEIKTGCIYVNEPGYELVTFDNPENEITFKAILQVYKWKKGKL